MTSATTLKGVSGYSQQGQALVLDCGTPRVAITPLSDTIMRVRLAPHGSFAPRRSWAIKPSPRITASDGLVCEASIPSTMIVPPRVPDHAPYAASAASIEP